MRILLVEDNADHRDLMSLALIGHDSTWEVKWVGSGEEALRLLLGGEVFDLVFLDYSLPQGDGLWFLEEIRRVEASPPVVMVTGRGDEGVAVEALKGGVYDYVVKQEGYLQRLPVVAWNAMAANRLALERKRAEDALRHQNEVQQTILDNIPVMVVFLDREGRKQLVNRCWQSTLGWSLEETQYKDVLAELYPNPAYRKYVLDFITAAAGTWGDFKTRTRDGRVLDTYWVNVPLSDGSNIGIGIDITEPKRAEEQLRSSSEQLRALSAHLQSIREEERTLIAREIHDELGQELTGLKMDLSWLIKRLPGNQELLVKKTESMSKLVDTTIQSVRRIATKLRPGVLDDFGLTAAIEWQAQDFQTRTGIQCEFNANLREIDLDRDRLTTVFRILQETLTNVARHASATRVDICLKEEAASLVLIVEDNGRGITEREISDPKSLGLLGMRERALVFGGEVKISGAPGKGTTVTLRIPIQK